MNAQHTPKYCIGCQELGLPDKPMELNGLRFCCDNQDTFECHIDDFPLYAAAPELFAACKKAAPWIGKLIAEGVHLECVMPNDAIRTLEMLEAAIAKATGVPNDVEAPATPVR